MSKAEKLHTDSEKNPLLPKEWVKGYPASEEAAFVPKGIGEG